MEFDINTLEECYQEGQIAYHTSLYARSLIHQTVRILQGVETKGDLPPQDHSIFKGYLNRHWGLVTNTPILLEGVQQWCRLMAEEPKDERAIVNLEVEIKQEMLRESMKESRESYDL